MYKKKYDAVIVGPIAGCDLILAEHLSRLGLSVIVLRKEKYKNMYNPPCDFFKKYALNSTVYFKKNFEVFPYLFSSRLVISFTGSLLGIVFPIWPVRKILKFPPVVNINTGSDIEEFAVSSGFRAFLYRYFLRTTNLNWSNNYPVAIKNIIALRLPNTYFFPFPFITDGALFHKEKKIRNSSSKLKLFHPASFDWAFTEKSPGRIHKANDIFLHGFFKALDQGLDAECLVLDRGQDRFEARSMIESSKHADNFIWKKQLDREELFQKMLESDIVVDQFYCGGIGGIMIEAMSLGIPVLTYINQSANGLLYPEMPPILNAKTSDDVAINLLNYADFRKLKSLGEQGQAWVHRYHNPKTYLNDFLFHCSRITGTDYFR